jgi:hypothetical protein
MPKGLWRQMPGTREGLGLGEYALRAPFRPGPGREEAALMVGTIQQYASINKQT